MKKTFSLTAPNKAPERQVDWTKHEIKKYLGREKRKALPEGVDFWDFDCRIGADEESAEVIFVNEIRPNIDKIVSAGHKTFYLEILAKPGKHNPNKKPRKVLSENSQEED